MNSFSVFCEANLVNTALSILEQNNNIDVFKINYLDSIVELFCKIN